MILSGSICKLWRIERANHFRGGCERQSFSVRREVWIAQKENGISNIEQKKREGKDQQDEEKRTANNQAFCRHADYQRKSDIIQNLPLKRNAQRRCIIIPLTENNKAQQTSSWTFINISSIVSSFSIKYERSQIKFSTPILSSFLCQTSLVLLRISLLL